MATFLFCCEPKLSTNATLYTYLLARVLLSVAPSATIKFLFYWILFVRKYLSTESLNSATIFLSPTSPPCVRAFDAIESRFTWKRTIFMVHKKGNINSRRLSNHHRNSLHSTVTMNHELMLLRHADQKNKTLKKRLNDIYEEMSLSSTPINRLTLKDSSGLYYYYTMNDAKQMEAME